MTVETNLLKLADCQRIKIIGIDFGGNDCTVILEGEHAKAIIEHAQHAIKTYGSTKTRMLILKRGNQSA